MTALHLDFLKSELKKYGEIADVDTIATISENAENTRIYNDTELAMYALKYHGENIMESWSDTISESVVEWALDDDECQDEDEE